MKPPLHEALRQVRDIQQAILEKQRFKGYSGRARALGGCCALAASFVLGSQFAPATPQAHFAGWAIVFALAVLLNHGAMAWWFFNDPDVGRDMRRLRPALAIVPALVVGGVLTMALVGRGEYDLLFGTWMAIYGIINFTSRAVLPRGLSWIGLYYLACGTACLLFLPQLSFTRDAWVMGTVFFIGEFFGGLVLHHDERPLPYLRTFFGLPAPQRTEELD